MKCPKFTSHTALIHFFGGFIKSTMWMAHNSVNHLLIAVDLLHFLNRCIHPYKLGGQGMPRPWRG